MKVLVCGGRDYLNQKKVSEVLSDIGPTSIIHGNASGADALADSWARANEVPVQPFPADWGSYGKKAGYFRNKQMLDEGKPDMVVAFPGGKGTSNMVKLAQEAGIPVQIAEIANERQDS